MQVELLVYSGPVERITYSHTVHPHRLSPPSWGGRQFSAMLPSPGRSIPPCNFPSKLYSYVCAPSVVAQRRQRWCWGSTRPAHTHTHTQSFPLGFTVLYFGLIESSRCTSINSARIRKGGGFLEYKERTTGCRRGKSGGQETVLSSTHRHWEGSCRSNYITPLGGDLIDLGWQQGL